jgi:hypothetical protein
LRCTRPFDGERFGGLAYSLQEVRPDDLNEGVAADDESHAAPKIGKNQDVQGMINRWEGYIHTLKRDFKEDVSDMMKIGILIHMMPDQLQDTILQAADRKAEYKHIKEKVVTLVDARARLRDPNAMDIGFTAARTTTTTTTTTVTTTIILMPQASPTTTATRSWGQ